MAATRTPDVSRQSIEASPVRRVASQASAISAIVGAVSNGDSGSAYTDMSRSVTPAVTAASSPGSTRLATTATTSHPATRIAVTPTSAAARTSVAARSWPETTHTTGRPRFAAMRALSASSRAAPASVKSLPTTKTLSQRAASARNRSTISDIALSSSARTSAYGTPRHASYGSGCGERGRSRSMDGSEPSIAATTGRKTPSRSTRRASRSNRPSETAALPVPGSQAVTYSPSDTRSSDRFVQEHGTALPPRTPRPGSGRGRHDPPPPPAVATREEISRAPASGAAPPDADPDRRRERSTRRRRFLTVDISVHRTFGEVSLTENSYSQRSRPAGWFKSRPPTAWVITREGAIVGWSARPRRWFSRKDAADRARDRGSASSPRRGSPVSGGLARGRDHRSTERSVLGRPGPGPTIPRGHSSQEVLAQRRIHRVPLAWRLNSHPSLLLLGPDGGAKVYRGPGMPRVPLAPVGRLLSQTI